MKLNKEEIERMKGGKVKSFSKCQNFNPPDSPPPKKEEEEDDPN